MSLENDLRKTVFRCWKGFASRIEPAVGSDFGFPDAMLSMASIPDALVEFKVLQGSGASTHFKMRRSQSIWHSDYLAAGGKRAFWCLMDEDGMYMMPSSLVMSVADGLLTVELREFPIPALTGYCDWSELDHNWLIGSLEERKRAM